MAKIRLELSTLSSEYLATNAAAQTIFGLYFDATAPKFDYTTSPATEITYTAQQRLDWVLSQIVDHVRTVAKAQRRRVKEEENETALRTELETINL